MRKRKLLKRISIALVAFLCMEIGIFVHQSNFGTIGYTRSLNLGNKYLLSEDYESAISAFSKAIDIDSMNAEAYVGRGDAYKAQGDYVSAWSDYETAQEISGDKSILRKKIGQTEITVISEDGRGVEGAAVVLNGSGHSYELTTDENGHASEVLFPEKYDVEIVKEEYDSLTTEVSAQDGGIVVDQIEIKKSIKVVVDPEKALREIDRNMGNYIFLVLMQEYDNKNQNVNVDVNLSDAEKIRAAVLAADSDGVIDSFFRSENGRIVLDANAEPGPAGDGYHGWSVSKQGVEDNCRNLFGTEAKWEEMQTINKAVFFDAVKYTDTSGTYALFLDSEIESETDMESHTYKVTESGDGYIGEVEFYWGYWGKLSKNPDLSNYIVTYEMKPNDMSSFGLVVTSMRITKIDEDTGGFEMTNSEPAAAETQRSTFYGVWCFASKDQNEAQKIANRMNELGLNGTVYISSDWSNLNQEKWYCVSAGSCHSESEAEAVLPKAINAGFTDAYIKYSGNYLR